MTEYIIEVANADCMVGSPFDTPYLREEIVRCRDCKFCHKNYCEKRISPTASPSEIHWIPVEPDGFCKWGERRDA